MTRHRPLGIIGARGWLGSAIVSAVLDAGIRSPDELTLSYRKSLPASPLEAKWTQNNQSLAESVDAIVVSVRPEDFPDVKIDAPRKLVISVMAGVSIAELTAHFHTDRVIRAMPNAATSVRHSFTPWLASSGCTAADRALAAEIFQACGVAEEVENEAQLDYFAAFTGTGPAYHALLADTLRLEAIARGIPPDIALRATSALLVGSGKLVEEDAASLADIVQDFIDYDGVTAAALRAMRDTPLSQVVVNGIEAALARARTLQNTS